MNKKNDGSTGMIKTDIKASSKKELYYEICSYLMRNRILEGTIYSPSKGLLDGLGEYMSSANIPWYYEKDKGPQKGYCFVDGYSSLPEIGEKDTILSADDTVIIRSGHSKIHNIRVTLPDIDSPVEEDFSNILHLKNEQITKMFLRTFVIAKEEIDIISPWMNFGVVNEPFENLMRQALQKGVKIKIIYGLKPDSSEYNLSRSNRSDQVADHLREIFSDYGDQLVIVRDNIHYKLVLCDERFKLEGGYNYLSFTGDYANEDTRREGSPLGTDPNEIKYLRKEYFENVK